MAVRLRLRRMGRKKLPVWAVVAADSRSPRDGRFIEDLGRYNPLYDPASVDLKVERIHYWLSQGAQPSDTVRNILSREGVLIERQLRFKGKPEEEIREAVDAHRKRRYEQLADAAVETPKARRQKALVEESKRMAKEEGAARLAEATRKKAEKEKVKTAGKGASQG